MHPGEHHGEGKETVGERREMGGRKGTIRSPTSTSVGRRGPHCVYFVSFCRVVVHVNQQTLKITDRVSVIHPHNSSMNCKVMLVGNDRVMDN